MKLKIKDIFFMTIIFVTCYLATPLAILKFYSGDDGAKLAFNILLILAFLSFATNIIYSYLRGFYFLVPLLSIILSFLLLMIFNSTAFVVIIVVAFLSFLGAFLGNLFTIKNEKEI